MIQKINNPFYIFLFSFFIFLSIALISYIFIAPSFKIFKIVEEPPLSKNKNFPNFFSGDFITYNIFFENDSKNITFYFLRERNCTRVFIKDVENLSLCISNNTMYDWFDYYKLDNVFFFFSPWMLSLNTTFFWNLKIVNTLSNEVLHTKEIKFIKKEEIFGREAFVVEVKDSGIFGNSKRKLWIDSEFRFLIKEESKNYTIIISSNPFFQPLKE